MVAEPLGQNIPAVITAVATLAVCIYYFGVWLFVGRDHSGAIVAISYEPPHNLSPVAMRYLLKKGLDEKGFTAALIDMAARGCIEIQEREDCYVFAPGTAEISSLPDEEKALADGLLKGGFAFELKNENHERVYQAIREMKHRLDILCEGVYFRSHRGYLIPGVLLSAVLMIYLALVLSSGSVSAFHALFLMPFVLVWTFVFILLLMYARHAWRSSAWLKGRPGGMSAGSIRSLLICLVDGVAEGAVLGLACVYDKTPGADCFTPSCCSRADRAPRN